MARNRPLADDGEAAAPGDVPATNQPTADTGDFQPVSAVPVETPKADGAEAPKPEEPPTYAVAGGCSIHCLKGAISAGKRIRAMDLAGGQEALDELVKSAHVVITKRDAET